MENSQKVLQCYYCGNSTLMNLAGEHKYEWDEDNGYYGYFNYQMYACQKQWGRFFLLINYYPDTYETNLIV